MKTRTTRSIWLAFGLAMLFTAFATASASASVTTGSATNVTASSAVLNGSANAEGAGSLICKFEYGTTTAYGTSAGFFTISGSTNTPKSQEITGLAQNTTYHFRFACVNSGSVWTYGEDKTFKTAALPLAITGTASDIHGLEVTLNGSVNPSGLATTYWFEWGVSTSYGNKLPVGGKSAGSGTSYIGVSEVLTGLQRKTTYHYRLVAQSAVGTTKGADKTVTTQNLPKAITEAPTGVTASGATLRGHVGPETLSTSYWFEYGVLLGNFEFKTEVKCCLSLGADVSQAITGLTAGTEYKVRLVAQNSSGTTYGSDIGFKTNNAPKVVTGGASGITASEATLNATVNPEGNGTFLCGFDLGTTTAYGTSVFNESGFSGFSETPFSVNVTGLAASTTYHYRAKCYNGATTFGADGTFVTTK